MAYGDGTADNGMYWQRYTGWNRFYIIVGGITKVFLESTLSNNTNHHLAVVREGNTFSMYVNGSLVDSVVVADVSIPFFDKPPFLYLTDLCFPKGHPIA